MFIKNKRTKTYRWQNSIIEFRAIEFKNGKETFVLTITHLHPELGSETRIAPWYKDDQRSKKIACGQIGMVKSLFANSHTAFHDFLNKKLTEHYIKSYGA